MEIQRNLEKKVKVYWGEYGYYYKLPYPTPTNALKKQLTLYNNLKKYCSKRVGDLSPLLNVVKNKHLKKASRGVIIKR